MALTDITEAQQTEAEAAALRIREIVRDMLGMADTGLKRIRMHVRGKRSAVAAELGADAATMLTVYNKLKDAIEAGKSVTIDDLPA